MPVICYRQEAGAEAKSQGESEGILVRIRLFGRGWARSTGDMPEMGAATHSSGKDKSKSKSKS